MEPQLKSTRLIDGEVKGIMDNYGYDKRKISSVKFMFILISHVN